jgi:hypothetical protein
MVVIHGLVSFSVWQTLSWVRLGLGKCDTDSWVGGGPYIVNVVARRIYGGDSWLGGGPNMVNAVARRIYGDDPWVGGGPYMVNTVAGRIYGGDPWVGEFCVWQTSSWVRLG